MQTPIATETANAARGQLAGNVPCGSASALMELNLWNFGPIDLEMSGILGPFFWKTWKSRPPLQAPLNSQATLPKLNMLFDVSVGGSFSLSDGL